MDHPILIIAPCYNENKVILKFLEELCGFLSKIDKHFVVVIVDDASTDNTLSLLNGYSPTVKNVQLKVLKLKYNLGHQGAIYQGLLYARSTKAEKIIIMDSDGEDDPSVIPELVRLTAFDIVNVVRGKRKEKLSFVIFYNIYKLLFYSITNKRMNFGNYCMINRKILEATVDTSFIHFAAHLSKQKAKTTQILSDRRKRIDGKSKMNLNSLVHHAFKSFVEYAEDLLMVFLKLFLLIGFGFFMLILFVIYKKLLQMKQY